VFQTRSINYIKCKDKVHPGTGHEGPEEEQRYSSTPSLTSALDWVWVVNATPRPLTPEKETWYPPYRRLGGLQSRFGRVRKISFPQAFDPRTVQPVAIRYTDYAINYIGNLKVVSEVTMTKRDGGLQLCSIVCPSSWSKQVSRNETHNHLPVHNDHWQSFTHSWWSLQILNWIQWEEKTIVYFKV